MAKTLLVVVYDEHGGFFDHVVPGRASDDDPATFGRYGVRVPVFFVGPYVDRAVCCKTIFDHASLIKTILARFCPEGDGIPDMGRRVADAKDIGEVLSLSVPRTAPALPQPVVDSLAAFASKQFLATLTGPVPATRTPNEEQFVAAVKKTQTEMQDAVIRGG